MADMDTSEKTQTHLSPDDGAVPKPDKETAEMSAEERALKEKEWLEELHKTEEEVNTLKQVLASKQKRVNDLKKLLGVGIVSRFSKDMNESITRLSESDVMLKANSAFKSAGEKTSAAFSTVGRKLEDVKNSEFMKSVEEKVGSAYDSVKQEWSRKRPFGPPLSQVNHAPFASFLFMAHCFLSFLIIFYSDF
ncbi:tumor protein D52-like isoform X2 [Watersipora subatra]|uniref:tumor protein D52-like isoform X2 n=1 Tax=Watersipora subatra TaxID=2589382 RepID=UPI00355C9A69